MMPKALPWSKATFKIDSFDPVFDSDCTQKGKFNWFNNYEVKDDKHSIFPIKVLVVFLGYPFPYNISIWYNI